MIALEGWLVLNFYTLFLITLLLIFQSKGSKMIRGRKYSAILILTLILLISESLGRVGEAYPDRYLILAEVGYFVIFALDPLDILFAVNYIDCWMDESNTKSKMGRNIFRWAFQIFAIINLILVLVSTIGRFDWFYYFQDGVYYRGPLYLIRALFLILFIILLVVYSILFRNSIMNDYKNTILFLPIFSVLGAILQVFISNMSTTYAGISLGCLVVYFFFQSKDVNLDYLTGVLNRRGLDIRLQEKIKASAASGRDFTAIMIDVDNFKAINDTLGHSAGDRAIKDIADVLVDIFGQEDSIGRFGGDEFCVITEIITPIDIRERIGEIRDEIAVLRRRRGWPRHVDISCGYEIYDHTKQLSAKKFAEIIDEKMYAEKEQHHSM